MSNRSPISKALAATLPTIDATRYRREGRFLGVYDRLLQAATPYIVNYGGGGSGKSYAQALFLVRRLLRKKHKLLVIRKFGSTLDDSVIDQFLEFALPFWGLKEKLHYKRNIARRRITFCNGSVIIFRGLDDPEKFKSIAGITLVWIEEATELQENDFKILSDRIRGDPQPQIYLTYNPISERHWLRGRFHGEDPHKGIDDRTTVIFSTFLDNPFVGQKYRDDMAWYAIHDEDHYNVYGLGKFGIIRPDNPYFTVWKRAVFIGSTAYNPHHPVYVSADFNVKNSFLISQHYGGLRIDYHEVIHGGDDLQGLCTQLAIKYGRNQIYFTGDGSGNNRSAYTSGNQSAWQLIRQYMPEAGAYYCDYEAVPQANASTASSRHICNALMVHFSPKPGAVLDMYGNPIGPKMTINPDCGILIDDIERMRATPTGDLDKADANKLNYGHIGDCFRYDLCNFESETFIGLGLSRKAA